MKPISIFSSNPIRIAALEWEEVGEGRGRGRGGGRGRKGTEEEEEEVRKKDEGAMRRKWGERRRMEWEKEEELESEKVEEGGGIREEKRRMEGGRGLLVSGAGDGQLCLWDIRKGKVGSWNGHLEEVCRVCWEEGGVNIASGGNDNSVAIWDIRNLKSCKKYICFIGPYLIIFYSLSSVQTT